MSSYPFKWNWFRLSVVCFGAIHGLFYIDTYQTDVFPIGFIQIFIIFLFTPFSLILIIGLQFLNKRASEIWKIPSWFLNPFNFKQPLQFFHFAAFFFVAIGVSSSISLIWKGFNCVFQAVLPLSIGIGLLIGIHLCLLIFKRKIEKNKTLAEVYRLF